MKTEWKYRNTIRDFEKDVKIYEAMNKELEKIRFVTKKDGTPFKRIEKNIEGLNVYNNRYSDHAYMKEISICVNVPGYGYNNDSIRLYSKDPEKKKNKPQNVNEDGVYILDVEDVKQAVKEKQTYYKKRIEESKNNIARFKSICEKCDEFVTSLNIDNSDLRMAISEYMKAIL